ncbi:unnamed protein product [Strongylus vulgaris]|uniref:Uncharacterized protein n=1 Tax=Strongylus vulgaris TaxID=40348 RepID=A0A3P7IL36_STRVU|nr:unnamed protein product [Strongylus vulgaris]
MSRPRDPAKYVFKAKHRWTGNIKRRIAILEWIPREAKRPRGKPTTRRADVFLTRMDQLNSQLVTNNGSGPRYVAVQSQHHGARDRNGWKQYCGLQDN